MTLKQYIQQLDATGNRELVCRKHWSRYRNGWKWTKFRLEDWKILHPLRKWAWKETESHGYNFTWASPCIVPTLYKFPKPAFFCSFSLNWLYTQSFDFLWKKALHINITRTLKRFTGHMENLKKRSICNNYSLSSTCCYGGYEEVGLRLMNP